MTKPWNHAMFSLRLAGNGWARVVLVHMLTEWRHFHFSYHRPEALKEGSSESSLALRRSINPLTAIRTKNKIIILDSWLQHSFRDMLWNCHDNNIFLTNLSLCFPCTENSSKTLKISDKKRKYQPCSLCCENHSMTRWSSSGYFRVKRPIVARFADIFSPPERIVTWSLLQRRTMDSRSPCSRAISKLFSSASTITLSWKPYYTRNDEL